MRPIRRRTWVMFFFFALIAGGGSISGQFASFTDNPGFRLEGNWQSCRESDGQYSERVYDGRNWQMPRFELHLGPYRQFALFPGIQDEHRDHSDAENLLQPYDVPLVGAHARQEWNVDRHGIKLHLEVVTAGGSRTDCESWFVVLTPLVKPTS